jgi:hypothetical protein
MTDLSPAALAIWEAFNEDEAGVFIDYGDKLAAACVPWQCASRVLTTSARTCSTLLMSWRT